MLGLRRSKGSILEAVERTADQAREREDAIFQAMIGRKCTINLGDRSRGKLLSVSLFDTEENLERAEPTFNEEIPRHLGDLMKEWVGRRVSVERYEVFLQQRPGA